MSDIWYYALDDKEVGPLPLADLTAILARASNPKDVLVWRAGYEKWQRAATVPELAAFVIKPPPPPQPTSSLPPVLPRDRLIAPAAAVQSSGTSQGKKWIAVVAIVIGVAVSL